MQDHKAAKKALERHHKKKMRYHDQGGFRWVFRDSINSTVHKVYMPITHSEYGDLRKASRNLHFQAEEKRAAESLDKKIPTAQLVGIHLLGVDEGADAEYEYAGEPIKPKNLASLKGEEFKNQREIIISHILQAVYAKEEPQAPDAKLVNWVWPDLQTYKYFVRRRKGAEAARKTRHQNREPIFVDLHPGSVEWLHNAREQKYALHSCYLQLINNIHYIETRDLKSSNMDITRETVDMIETALKHTRRVKKDVRVDVMGGLRHRLRELEKQ